MLKKYADYVTCVALAIFAGSVSGSLPAPYDILLLMIAVALVLRGAVRFLTRYRDHEEKPFVPERATWGVRLAHSQVSMRLHNLAR